MSENPSGSRLSRSAFWLVVLLLVGAQQWSGAWSSKTLVLGFLPSPLFYHVMVSLAAVAVWWVGTIVAWPDDTKGGAALLSDGEENPTTGPSENEVTATGEPS